MSSDVFMLGIFSRRNGMTAGDILMFFCNVFWTFSVAEVAQPPSSYLWPDFWGTVQCDETRGIRWLWQIELGVETKTHGVLHCFKHFVWKSPNPIPMKYYQNPRLIGGIGIYIITHTYINIYICACTVLDHLGAHIWMNHDESDINQQVEDG